MTDLVAFKEEVFQDVVGAADAESIYLEDAFFDYFCDYLVDAGELDTHDRAAYDSPKGVRVDGYGGDPLVNDEVLSLIILDFVQDESKPTLTRTDMDKAFKRAMNFLSKSLEPSFREAMEPTLPAFGLADLIAVRWQRIRKVRLLLVSNRELSTRIDSVTASEVDGKAITHSVWDISRLHRYVAAGREREDIEIDLEDGFGGAIPVLPAHSGSAKYKSYLAVVPGQQLAAIYERWGTRLLEQNVRVFLQARGNVNKGIRNTIENAPEMFLAYNNGIAATAESLELRENGGQLEITGLRNMQIVNGGQTTASIHVASRRKDLDISKVFVQMKLSIVERERVIEVVPKISEYANTQNRVNAADFFANHPFHVRME
ncbi:MAG: AIPR family protein, partial [Actinomycetota bacterium]|nr:AIPR family protein [Actinomycetota bacterium]